MKTLLFPTLRQKGVVTSLIPNRPVSAPMFLRCDVTAGHGEFGTNDFEPVQTSQTVENICHKMYQTPPPLEAGILACRASFHRCFEHLPCVLTAVAQKRQIHPTRMLACAKLLS